MNSTRLSSLHLQKDSIVAQMQTTSKINIYQKLKVKLKDIEKSIAMESGKYNEYTFIKGIEDRIDELKTQKAVFIWEKKDCRNIKRYWQVYDELERLNKAINENQELLRKARSA